MTPQIIAASLILIGLTTEIARAVRDPLPRIPPSRRHFVRTFTVFIQLIFALIWTLTLSAGNFW